MLTRLLIILVATTHLLSCTSALGQEDTPATLSPKEILKRYGPAVVRIELVKDQVAKGHGTGFIVSPDGLIVTNYHVIQKAFPAHVKLANGDIYDRIDVVEWDPRRDLAVIKIPGFNLPTVVLGDSDRIEVGSPVVVIGNPLESDLNISYGLISGILVQEGQRQVQMSAPIYSGSRGSPAFNEAGKVIGVAVSSLTEGQRLNFAVPINYVQELLKSSGRSPLGDFVKAEAAAAKEFGLSAEETVIDHYEILKPTTKWKQLPWIPLPAMIPDLQNVIVVNKATQKSFIKSDAEKPGRNEFVVHPDNTLHFCPVNDGENVMISFTSRRKRVAVFPVIQNEPSFVDSGSGRLLNHASMALMEGFKKWGFELVPEEQVPSLLKEGIRLDDVMFGYVKALAPGRMKRIARKLGAYELVASWVAYAEDRYGQALKLTVVIIDGRSGEPVHTKIFRIPRVYMENYLLGYPEVLSEFTRSVLGTRYGKLPVRTERPPRSPVEKRKRGFIR